MFTTPFKPFTPSALRQDPLPHSRKPSRESAGTVPHASVTTKAAATEDARTHGV
jgi:hypothetical protein